MISAQKNHNNDDSFSLCDCVIKNEYLHFFSTSQECPAGYYGLHCNESCPFPSYGVSCRLHCTCEINYCHNVYGCYKEETAGMRQLLNCKVDIVKNDILSELCC